MPSDIETILKELDVIVYEQMENVSGEAIHLTTRLRSALAAKEDEVRKMREQRDKLAAFKAYVHMRLDAMGVPLDPDSPHKAEGCRVGGRLDWVFKKLTALASQSPASPDTQVQASPVAAAGVTKEDTKDRLPPGLALHDVIGFVEQAASYKVPYASALLDRLKSRS